MIGSFLYSIFQIRDKSKFYKNVGTKSSVSDCVCICLRMTNTNLFFSFLQGDNHRPSHMDTNIVPNLVMGLVVEFVFKQTL